MRIKVRKFDMTICNIPGVWDLDDKVMGKDHYCENQISRSLPLDTFNMISIKMFYNSFNKLDRLFSKQLKSNYEN